MKNNKKDWNDISLAKYYKIVELLKETDEYTTFNLLDLIYDIDSSNMPLSEFAKYKDALTFLSSEPKTKNIKKHYILNGRKYNSNFNLTKVTAGQFIDYQSYVRDKQNKYENYLSVFFIPDGHKYADGYDIEEVKKDLLELPITVVKSISFFFTLQLARLSKLFLHYFKRDMKTMEMPKDKQEEIMSLLKVVDSNNLALFH